MSLISLPHTPRVLVILMKLMSLIATLYLCLRKRDRYSYQLKQNQMESLGLIVKTDNFWRYQKMVASHSH